MDSGHTNRVNSHMFTQHGAAGGAAAAGADEPQSIPGGTKATSSPMTSLTEHHDWHTQGRNTTTTVSPTPLSQRTLSSYGSRESTNEGPSSFLAPALLAGGPAHADSTTSLGLRVEPGFLEAFTSAADLQNLSRQAKCMGDASEVAKAGDDGTDEGYRTSSERTTPRLAAAHSVEAHSRSSSVSLGDWRTVLPPSSTHVDVHGGHGLATPRPLGPAREMKEAAEVEAPQTCAASEPLAVRGRARRPLASLLISPRSPPARHGARWGQQDARRASQAHGADDGGGGFSGRAHATSWTGPTPVRDVLSGHSTVSDDPLSLSAPLTRQRTSQLSMELSSSSSAVGGHHITLTQGTTFLKQSGSRREERFYQAIQCAQDNLVECAVRHTPEVLRAYQERQQAHTQQTAWCWPAGARPSHWASPPLLQEEDGEAYEAHEKAGDVHARWGGAAWSSDAAQSPRTTHEAEVARLSSARWLRGYQRLLQMDAAAAEAALLAPHTPTGRRAAQRGSPLLINNVSSAGLCDTLSGLPQSPFSATGEASGRFGVHFSPTSAATNTNASSPSERWLRSPMRVPSARVAVAECGRGGPAEAGWRVRAPSADGCDEEGEEGEEVEEEADEARDDQPLSMREECMVRLAASLWWLLPVLPVDTPTPRTDGEWSSGRVTPSSSPSANSTTAPPMSGLSPTSPPRRRGQRLRDSSAVEAAPGEGDGPVGGPGMDRSPSVRHALALLAPFVARFVGLRHLPLHAVTRAAAAAPLGHHCLPAAQFAAANPATVAKVIATQPTVHGEVLTPAAALDVLCAAQPTQSTQATQAAADCRHTTESGPTSAHPRDADAYEAEEVAEEVGAGTAPGTAFSTTSNNTSALSVEPTVRMVTLEDVCFGFVRPCVLDVKMGSRQYGLRPSDAKRKSKEKKSAQSTSGVHGVRLAGFKYWDDRTQTYAQKSKLQCRSLSLEELRADMHNFLRQDPALCRNFRDQVARLIDVFSQQSAYRFYTSSLLFVYDAKYPVESARLVMVDFAYTYQHEELVHDEDPDADQMYDERYLVGLRTLLRLLTPDPTSPQ